MELNVFDWLLELILSFKEVYTFEFFRSCY